MSFLEIQIDRLPPGGQIRLPNRVLPFIFYFFGQTKWQLLSTAFFFSFSSILFSLFPYGGKLIVDAVGHAENAFTLNQAIIIFCSIIFGYFVFEAIGSSLSVLYQSAFTNLIRWQVAQYVSQHSYRYFQDDFAGRVSGKVLETPRAMRQFVFTILDQGVYILALFGGLMATLSNVSPLFMGAVMMYLAMYIIILSIMVPRISRLTADASRWNNIMRGRYTDVIGNILLVKLFARRDHESVVMADLAKQNVRGWIRRDTANTIMTIMIFMALFIFMGTCLYLIALRHAESSLTPGDTMLIVSTMIMITGNSLWFSRVVGELFQSYGEIYEGIEAITTPHDVTDAPAAPAITITKGDIALQNLIFAYPGRPVFENLSLRIPPGQKVGLVGPSGAGKSTFVQLLLRLFDLQGGAILIDGQNIAHVQQDSLRAQIAVIPQSSDLMHRSIADNIAYGRLDATREEIIDAAKQAHAHDFILQLRDKEGRTGYDAHVGERGVKLSGGQRQRVAIARAILKNAPILVLDEATSSLDSESEALVQDALFRLMEGKTVIAIAHRLSTIRRMDRLLVLNDGKIVEDGPHGDLMQKDGFYARLWARQVGDMLDV